MYAPRATVWTLLVGAFAFTTFAVAVWQAATASAAPIATPAFTYQLLPNIPTCDVDHVVADLAAEGVEVVAMYPSRAYETTDENVCPCPSAPGVHCFPAPGWHTVEVSILVRYDASTARLGLK